MSIYRELIDAGYEEAELERRIGEGWTVEEIHEEAVQAGFFEDAELGAKRGVTLNGASDLSANARQ